MPIKLIYTLPAAKTADFIDQAIGMTTAAIQPSLPDRQFMKDVLFIAQVGVTGTTSWKITVQLANTTDNDIAEAAAVIVSRTTVLLAKAAFAQVGTSQGLVAFPFKDVGSLEISFVENSGTGSIDTCLLYMCWPDN